MLVPAAFTMAGAAALGLGCPPAAMLAAVGAAVSFTREQRLGFRHRCRYAYKRWKETKPNMDSLVRDKIDQRKYRRKVRVCYSLLAFITKKLETAPEVSLAGCFGNDLWSYARVEKGHHEPKHHDDIARLHHLLVRYPTLRHGYERARARKKIMTIVAHRALAGRLVDLLAARAMPAPDFDEYGKIIGYSDKPIVRAYMMAAALGISEDKQIPLADLGVSDLAKGIAIFRLSSMALVLDAWKKEDGFVNSLLGGESIMRHGKAAGSIEVRRLMQLPEIVPLSPKDAQQLPLEMLAVGIDRLTTEQIRLNVLEMFHLLICGASRWGKSVLLHAILSQILMKAHQKIKFEGRDGKVEEFEMVEKIYCADLKGAVELGQYERQYKKRVEVVHAIPDVMRVVSTLVKTLDLRLSIMRKRGWKVFRGPRIFFVVDEFAIIEQYKVNRSGKDFKTQEEAREQMMMDLLRLSQQAAAAGIILIVAIQKPTTDGMASSFRGNFEGVFLFRVQAKTTAGALLGPTDDLLIDPTRGLRKGEAVFRDPILGEDRYVRIYFTEAAKDLAEVEDIDEPETEVVKGEAEAA